MLETLSGNKVNKMNLLFIIDLIVFKIYTETYTQIGMDKSIF